MCQRITNRGQKRDHEPKKEFCQHFPLWNCEDHFYGPSELISHFRKDLIENMRAKKKDRPKFVIFCPAERCKTFSTSNLGTWKSHFLEFIKITSSRSSSPEFCVQVPDIEANAETEPSAAVNCSEDVTDSHVDLSDTDGSDEDEPGEDFESRIARSHSMFFLKLQTHFNVSQRAIQEIAEDLVNLYEVSSEVTLRRLTISLAKYGLKKDEVLSIYNETVESSSFLRSAQKGEVNSTTYRRDKYYTSQPGYVEPGKLDFFLS